MTLSQLLHSSLMLPGAVPPVDIYIKKYVNNDYCYCWFNLNMPHSWCDLHPESYHILSQLCKSQVFYCAKHFWILHTQARSSKNWKPKRNPILALEVLKITHIQILAKFLPANLMYLRVFSFTKWYLYLEFKWAILAWQCVNQSPIALRCSQQKRSTS